MFRRTQLFLMFVALGLFTNQLGQAFDIHVETQWAMYVAACVFGVVANWSDDSQYPE